MGNGEKNKYHMMPILSKLIYDFSKFKQCCQLKPSGIFGKPKSLILKFMWNSKELKIRETI